MIANKNLKAIVTTGPTREYIDQVRYITNKSSGKQGYEIAKSLAKMGVETTIITGPTSLDEPNNVKVIKVETAKEMLNQTTQLLPTDIVVCAAAVCDFKVTNYKPNKIKKNNIKKLDISLEKNIDILDFLGKHNSLRPKLLVGFSAEVKNIIDFAKEKMLNKRCDLMVANDVSDPEIGFDSDKNEVFIIYKNNKIEKIEKDYKNVIAEKISKKIINYFI